MNLTLKVWRQKNANDRGGFETYPVKNISSEMSFLEMIDVLNEELIHQDKDPIAFDHDCREGDSSRTGHAPADRLGHHAQRGRQRECRALFLLQRVRCRAAVGDFCPGRPRRRLAQGHC